MNYYEIRNKIKFFVTIAVLIKYGNGDLNHGYHF